MVDEANDRTRDVRPGVTGGTRGFLFADLRGYTAFLERNGAVAAAALLEAYRELVRDAVAEHAGAEIRTEGDSFYVVFANASAAVACGISIVGRAAARTREAPSVPINVGIGVHAGETVETAEGYVGAAVNIAARLCAVANAGEVLVSDTVRALTSGVAPVRYEPRGRRRLKGVGDAVMTYRAVDATSSARVKPAYGGRDARRPAAAVIAMALVAMAVVAIAAGLSGLQGGTPGAPPSSPHASPASPAAAPAAGTASTTASPTVEAPAGLASASPVASASAVAEQFPTTGEAVLLRRLPAGLGDDCRRDRSALYPTTRVPTVGPPGTILVSAEAPSDGLKCDLPLGQAARTLWLRQYRTPAGLIDDVEGLISIHRAPFVPCGDGPTGSGTWQIGERRVGSVVCWGGDDQPAWIAWTYEPDAILATAVNDHGEWQALHDWWRSTARYLDR